MSETRCTGLCPKSLHLLIVLIEIEIYRQGIYLKIQLGWEFSYENDKTWHIGRILHSESIAGWCQADFHQLHLQNSIVFNMVAIRSPSWIWRHFENIKHFFFSLAPPRNQFSTQKYPSRPNFMIFIWKLPPQFNIDLFQINPLSI